MGGIEGYVVVTSEVERQQTDEIDKDFLDALGRLAVNDGTALGVLQVEQEDGIEHLKDLALVDVAGVLVTDDFLHFHEQELSRIGRQGLFRLMQLYDGQVGNLNKVVDGWCLNGCLYVSH